MEKDKPKKKEGGEVETDPYFDFELVEDAQDRDEYDLDEDEYDEVDEDEVEPEE